jgi:hypothetical protein
MLRARIFLLCIGLLGGLGEGESLLSYMLYCCWEDGRWRGCDTGREGLGNLGVVGGITLAYGQNADELNSDTPLRLLTKGDNNVADDTELYARGQSFLNRKEDVIGSVVGFIPFVGYVTILLSEYPWLKQAMLGIMGLMVVLQRE